MSETYYVEEIERIDGLLVAKRELILGTSLECQGLKMLRRDFEQKLVETLKGYSEDIDKATKREALKK